MLSTMQDIPLSVSRILKHGTVIHARSEVITWTGRDPERRTYAEVGARAAQLAHALRHDLGVTGDERVATLMWNNAEHLEAYLAIPSMGAVLHTLNHRLSDESLAYIVNHADDHAIILDGSLIPTIRPIIDLMKGVQHLIVSGADKSSLEQFAESVHPQVHDYEGLLAQHSTEYPWPEIDERSAAALCYTSGTTGDPKGVAYSHRSIYLHSLQMNLGESLPFTPEDLFLPVVPMFHVNAWGFPHAAFMSGANLLMPDRFLQPIPLADMIADLRPTSAAGIPTIWQGLLEELRRLPRDVSSLHSVFTGGASCPPSLMKAFEDELGLLLIQAWGMTETSPIGSIARPPSGLGPKDAWPYRITQGRFPASVEARLTSTDGAVQPWDGESVGELELRGPWVTASYYGGALDTPVRPDDKFSPDGWLRTGDLGSISPDGYLTLTDRLKDVIKSGGEWISSVDLENHLMTHPAVSEAAVIAVSDTTWGERPLAVVVLRDGANTSHHDLSVYLGERIPKWQVPERWTTVTALPKTSVGKIDKMTLRGHYAEGLLAEHRVSDDAQSRTTSRGM
jgi:fatty-acyl-CoA synthase